ncbi:MAG TPA: AraC family transcriptional regulator [Actinoplanes sp.]
MQQQAPQRVSFRSASPERIRDFWHTALGWQVVFDRTVRRPGECRLETAMLGGLSIGRQAGPIGYTGSSKVSDSYVAWVSTRGRSWYQVGSEEYASTSDHMLAYPPGERRRLGRCAADTESTYLTLESWLLERHLEKLLGRPVTGPIDLAPRTELRSGPGRTWLSILQVLGDMMLGPDNALPHPAVFAPLSEAMMTSLLLSVDHQYRDALARPAATCRPRHVRRAVDAIHAHPEHPYTVSSLAEVAGVSVRTLQQGFRAHLNASPMAYLRHIRLARAHEELSRDDTVTVAEVAFRWGFTHLGRFAAAYARQYGTLPSHSGQRTTA